MKDSANENSNVFYADIMTTLDFPLERVMDGGKELEWGMAVGINKDGSLYVASSKNNRAQCVLLLHKALAFLVRNS